MPATKEIVSEFETVTRMCCFTSSVLVAKNFVIRIDGAAVIRGSLQYGAGNGTPNMENVARFAAVGAAFPRSTYLLAYYMLRCVEADGLQAMRIAAAHNGVLWLRETGFVNVTNNTGKALELAGQEMRCTDLAGAAVLCRAAFLAANPGVEITY